MRLAGFALFATVALAAPLHAASVAVDAPGGRAGDAAVAIARQTGTSIVITDSLISNRRVPPIKGRLSADKAVKRLAKAAGAKAIKAGANGWRLVPAAVARASTPRPAGRAATAPPPAPDQPAAELQIVVTGSKRDILLEEYAGQVSLLDGETLTFGGVGGTEKISQMVPSVSSTHLGSGRNKLFIRGIADSSFTGPTQSTVGQYFGDLRLSYNAPDPDLRLSDMSRVEILEGPQGTLYGAGALGGIVRLVPNPPQMGVVSGSGQVGGSGTQHGALGADASATLNFPLGSDSVAMRVTVDGESRGGYIDKPLAGQKDVNRTNILGGRAAVRFDTGGGWSVDLIGIGQAIEGQDSQYADRTGPPLTRAARVGEGFDADYLQGQLVVSGEFGDVRFRSSTGLTAQNLKERYDATQPEGPTRLFVQTNDTRMFANETRLWQPLQDSFGWLLGLSYTRNRTTLARTLGTVEIQTATTGVRNSVDEATIYGEASLRLTDRLIATAGGRYTWSWLNGEGEDISYSALTELAARALADSIAEREESAFLPSASLTAQVMEGTSLYMRYQEGFRPGGLSVAGEVVTRFRNDHISTFEFGGRHGEPGFDPFDISANISFTRWRDIQADFIDSLGLPSTANIGDGRIWSVSVNGSAEVAPGFRIDAGFTYNDSQVDEAAPFLSSPAFGDAKLEPQLVLSPDFTTGRANQIPNIARFAGRTGFEYRAAVSDDLDLRAQGWVQYVGQSRLGVGPELGEEQGDYLDTGLTVRVGRDNIGVTLGLTNLTDAKGNRFALGTPFAIGRDQITPLRPRTIRIGLDASF